ncbi:MAG: hypothetical protein HYT88_07400 [Candidatus Omnitrophica bacterium]|nr:hypothetical protein [Candidatus Omnitrophota bacterium]
MRKRKYIVRRLRRRLKTTVLCAPESFPATDAVVLSKGVPPDLLRKSIPVGLKRAYRFLRFLRIL